MIQRIPQLLAVRSSATIAVIATAVFSLTGCDGGTAVEREQTPAQAKEAVVAIVDDTANAVGGAWSVASGPAVQGCNRDSGGRGAAYFTTKMREQRSGDPAEDVANVERLWKEKGIETERYKSGGAEPTLGLRGVGGPMKSIDFLADERGYSLDAVSSCTAGDAEELQRNGE
ncbi:hypothetical protein [Curtobacterium sp. NPDC089991]|uniref:hypothetical protein n=1 Tax=Curtobacterium sp. NPDC089991 TaxID=3363969 RepID=UPI00382533DB